MAADSDPMFVVADLADTLTSATALTAYALVAAAAMFIGVAVFIVPRLFDHVDRYVDPYEGLSTVDRLNKAAENSDYADRYYGGHYQSFGDEPAASTLPADTLDRYRTGE